MMASSICRGGFVRAALLPWLVTAAGAVLLVTAPDRPSLPTEAPGGNGSAELRSLRLAISTLTSQNAALRRELDRFLGGTPSRSDAAATRPGDASAPVAAAEGSAALAGTIRDALALAARGDTDEATHRLTELLRTSPAALAALQAAYLERTDPDARRLLLPAILSHGGDEARGFLLEQIRRETDPELRRALLEQAAGFATPIHAEELKHAFLGAVEEGDEDTRRAALRGLRYAGGDEVEATLLDAASDPSEEVRLAAIESLAPRPEFEDELERLLAEESSPHVRELGRCRLVLNRPLRRSEDTEPRSDR